MYISCHCIFCGVEGFVDPRRTGITDWEYNLVGKGRRKTYIWFHKSCLKRRNEIIRGKDK